MNTSAAILPGARRSSPRRLAPFRGGRSETPALIEFQSPTAAVIAEPLPVAARLTIWIITATVAAAVATMGLCSVDRIVSVPGKVVAQAANIQVQPLEVAIVREIDVKEGQAVHAGDLLARLDPTFAAADVTASAAEAASLKAEVERLNAEAEDRPYLPDGSPASQLQALIHAQRHAERSARLEGYRQKIDAAQARVTQARTDVAGYAEQFRAAVAKEKIRRELERLQVGSRLNTLDAGAQRAEVERTLEAANAAGQAAQGELASIAAERDGYLDQLRRETLQELTEQGRKLADAEQQRNKAALRRKLVELRADRDAIVLNVASVSVGSVLQSGEALITLVPADSRLEVEAGIDGRDAGFARAGQPAVIKFDTFPYTTYGYARGHVRSVSADSFSDPERSRSSGQAAPRAAAGKGNAYFRAHVTLDETKLRHLPAGYRLTPGMPVTVDVKVGRRTVLAYLLSRALPVLAEGFRDP